MHDMSRNPEMFAHMEGTVSLYREINSILKGIAINSLKYGDLLRPSRNTNYSNNQIKFKV